MGHGWKPWKWGKRDESGRIVDGPVQRIRTWWLGRMLRKGKVPRGRVLSSQEVKTALTGGIRHKGVEFWGILSIRVFRGTTQTWEDLGVVCVQKITTAFRDALVDSLQGAFANWGNFKYHGCGTGTTAEANTQTALVTEVGSRATGTQIEGATSDIYKSVGTVTPGGTYAITEHGLFSAATTGTMMDRSVFSAINVVAADSIQFSYEATFAAEA